MIAYPMPSSPTPLYHPGWGRRMAEERAGYTAGDPADAPATEQTNDTGSTSDRASCWFAKVPATVIRDRRLTAGARDVLIDLLLYANAQGRCYPKQNTIANDLGVKRQMVNRHLRTLRLLGYLVIESGKERGAQCVYHINLTPPLQPADGGETLSDTHHADTPSDSGGVSSEVTGGETLSDTQVKLKVTAVSRQVSPLTDPSNRPSEQSQVADPTQTDANASGVADSQRDSRAPSGVEIEIIRPAYTHPLIAAELAQMVADLDRATTVATGPIVDADPADEWGRDDLPPADTADVTADTPFKPTPLADAITQRGQSRPPIARGPQSKQTDKPAARREPKPIDNAEQQWCRELMEAFAAEKGVKTLPKAGAEKQAAKWYYQELLGVEDGVGKVITCYRVTRLNPFWARTPLTLLNMQEWFSKYRLDPTDYRKAQEDAAAGRKSGYTGQGATQGPPARLSRWYSQQRNVNESPEDATAKAVAAIAAAHAQRAATVANSTAQVGQIAIKGGER